MAAVNKPPLEIEALQSQASNIRDVRRRRGTVTEDDAPVYIPLSDDLIVGVRLRNMEALIALDAIPNELVNAAMSMGRKKDTERTLKDFRESVELQDVVFANMVVDPIWQSMDDIRANNGVEDPDKLNLGMLSDEEIAAGFHLVYKGLPSWLKFRAELRRSIAMEASDAARDAAELAGLAPTPD